MNQVIAEINRRSRRYGLDPAAVRAVASVEGGLRYGAIGDRGSSYGPFQLHQGGALPRGRGADWVNSPAGIDYALRQMARYARGKTGRAAVAAIVQGFERPANIPAEIAKASSRYGIGGGTTATPGVPGMTPPRQSQPELVPNPNVDLLRGQIATSLMRLGGSASPDYSPLFQQIAQLRATPAYKTIAPPAAGTPGFQVQGPVDGRVGRAVQLAKEYLGTPYKWGGTTPGGFDCSGLLQFIYAKQGVRIPRRSQQQWHAGAPVAKGALRPGDAVFFEATASGPGHVGVYIGGGRFIEAPHTGAVVRISRLAGRRDYVGGRRFT